MTTVGQPTGSFTRYVDHENGLISRAVYSDPELYKMELERIFARSWLFMCHESQIAKPGDFFQTYMGEAKVLVTRARDMSIQVLLNTCMHRGNSVCKADSGNAKTFMCTYHGWTYNLEGKLVGVPGAKKLYNGDFDKEAWSLRRAAHVDSYRGFVFATLDPAAPTLDEFLGAPGKFIIDRLAGRGEMKVRPGIIKHRMRTNWKVAVENDQDYYHPAITHASYVTQLGTSVDEINNMFWAQEGRIILGEYGHVADSLTEYDHSSIFPHMTLFTSSLQILEIRHPKGPMETENWYFCFTDENASAEEKEAARMNQLRRVGPAGLVEQDDGENFELSTRGTATAAVRDSWLNFSMGLGLGEMVDDPQLGFPVMKSPFTTDAYVRWSRRAWVDWMNAADWPSLIDNHARPGEAR
ncbi:Rieske 2Fe-2S domain-containing protein [Nocardia sp. R7R-8]|uniref:Rieske 2Fe-2S domain-containing protein n=1 Tax=Nocardia sp. R7R-8 TaxID=3459304 RepID=UPI00403DA242